MKKNEAVKSNHKKLTKLYIFIIVMFVLFLFGIFYFLKPMIIEEYCANQARKIVGNQWGKLYPAEGSEKQYVSQITWGFREQLKCEQKFH
jgi:hypothetical protein